MKEIGGFFGLEGLISNEYHKDLIPLNSGRNALLCLEKAKNIKKLYIPFFLCDVVNDMLRINGYDFENYHIGSNFIPIFDKTLGKGEYLYIVNYYGQLDNEKIMDLKRKYKQIILDNTHAFFQRPIKNIDSIYTCRKFFGVPDGAYLSTDICIKEDLCIDISKDRMKSILGRYEGTAAEYYSDFLSGEDKFKTEIPKYMSRLTHNILGAIDYENVRRIRNENYTYLNNSLALHNKLNLMSPDGAFVYPFYVENGVEIRKKLVAKKIYIPTLWPNVLKDSPYGSIEYNYAANILPLPCDQRYDTEDMKIIIDNLQICGGYKI